MSKHNCKQTRTKSFKKVDTEARKKMSDRFKEYFRTTGIKNEKVQD